MENVLLISSSTFYNQHYQRYFQPLLTVCVTVFLVMSVAVPVLADDKNEKKEPAPNPSTAMFRQGLNKVAVSVFGGAQPRSGSQFSVMAGEALAVVLSFIGAVFFALMVYGGVLWFFASGNKNEAEKAREVLYRAAIGLVIVLSSYVVTSYVTEQIVTITTPE